MSHHFDTPTAREDPRINVCDFYLFRGRPGFTVMAMTVNPNAGQSAPDTFREEGLYAFRFDLDGDAREELSFTVRFGAVFHSDDDNHAHTQSFEVRRASGSAATSGADGELIAAGHIGSVVEALLLVLLPICSQATPWPSASFVQHSSRKGRFIPRRFKTGRISSPDGT